MRNTIWVISVRLGMKRKDIIVETKEEETVQDTYRRAKKVAEIAKERTQGLAVIELISRSVAFKPKGDKPHKSWYWCPYCNKWRVFRYDDYLDVNRCSVCGISDHDFYVKLHNGIFKRESIGIKGKRK